MSSTKYFQHGDLPRTHLDFLDHADLTPFTFDGNGTQRDAITAKDKMINALRRRGLEEFITKPLVDLLPNKADYNTRSTTESRSSTRSDASILTSRNFLQTAYPEWIWALSILMKFRETNKFKHVIKNF